MLYGYYTFDLPNHRQCFTMNAGVNSCFRDDQDKQLPEAFSALTDSSTLHHCHTAKTKRRKTFNHHQKNVRSKTVSVAQHWGTHKKYELLQ